MSVVTAPGSLGERPAQLPTEDAPHHREGLRREATPRHTPAGDAEHTALVDVERRVRALLVSAAGARVEERMEAFEGEQLPEEGRGHERVRRVGEGAERAHEHAVEGRSGLALLRDLVGGLEHRHRVGEAPVVLAQAPGWRRWSPPG